MRAKRKVAYVLVLLAGLFESTVPLQAEVCRVTPNPGTHVVPREILPFKLFHNYLPVVQARLGNSPEPRNFVLDTGTTPSIINVTLARQLELATTTSKLADIGQFIPTQSSTLPEVDLGPVRAISLPVKVQDLSRMERDLGIPIAGILGLDVLSKSSFHLDYEKGELQFGDISPEGIPVQGIPVHFDPEDDIAVVDVKINGRPTRMLVDTGTDRVVLFGGNFKDLGWLALRNTSQQGRSMMNRVMPVQVFSAPDIQLGKQHFTMERAYVVAGSTDPAVDGLLGVRALGFRGLSYDHICGTMYLVK